jgi:DNA-directed RNA polymerase specialized sigma24 family protein
MSEPPPIAEVDNASPLSRAEIDSAIKFLTVAEKTKIMKIAAQYAKMTPHEAEDLYHEACVRAMEGKRTWPRGLPATKFFWGVMRSVAWEWKRKDEPLDENIGDKGAEERRLLDRNHAVKIMDAFDDDPIAQKILVAIVVGARGEELLKLSGLSPTDYASKRKKIRRRIEKVEAEKK